MKREFAWLKHTAAACALLLGLSVFSLPAFGYDAPATAGIVSVSTNLRVRSAGNTGASILGRLTNGASVTVLSSYNGWYKIKSGSLTGWVSAAYIKSMTTSGSWTTQANTAVNTADRLIGVPYLYGGATTAGFDCSGLTQYVYAKAGISLPHSSSAQATKGAAVARAALQPGDLVFFSTNGSGSVNHTGIYLGANLFIAANTGGVAVCDLSGSYWSGVYLTARRVTG